jgi:hypothetical protein
MTDNTKPWRVIREEVDPRLPVGGGPALRRAARKPTSGALSPSPSRASVAPLTEETER